MRQLLQVLAALHAREIVHCNIKRENILYAKGKLTVIDFEDAVHEQSLVNQFDVSYQSNPFHSAPELLKYQRGSNKHGHGVFYGHRRDVYGAGIIMAELLLGMDEDTRFLDHHECGRHNRLSLREDFAAKLQGDHGHMQDAMDGLQWYGKLEDTEFNEHGADLVKHLTLLNRFARARAGEALEHSFFHLDLQDCRSNDEHSDDGNDVDAEDDYDDYYEERHDDYDDYDDYDRRDDYNDYYD
eukprot:s1390_g12.t1